MIIYADFDELFLSFVDLFQEFRIRLLYNYVVETIKRLVKIIIIFLSLFCSLAPKVRMFTMTILEQ